VIGFNRSPKTGIGINGLIPDLKGAQEIGCPIESMAGKKAAIDVSVWFYKSNFHVIQETNLKYKTETNK